MGKTAKQRVNLPLGLLDCAVGMDDGIGKFFFLEKGHLGVNALLCLCAVESIAQGEALDLRFTRNGNDPNDVKQRLHAAFIEQRDIADDELFGGIQGVELPGNLARIPYVRVLRLRFQDQTICLRDVDICDKLYGQPAEIEALLGYDFLEGRDWLLEQDFRLLP